MLRDVTNSDGNKKGDTAEIGKQDVWNWEAVSEYVENGHESPLEILELKRLVSKSQSIVFVLYRTLSMAYNSIICVFAKRTQISFQNIL